MRGTPIDIKLKREKKRKPEMPKEKEASFRCLRRRPFTSSEMEANAMKIEVDFLVYFSKRSRISAVLCSSVPQNHGFQFPKRVYVYEKRVSV
ncbi:hypothetical protein L2E82_40339 [Cichorium intybus]|uniref:Uncharacterized protein n=1 Tax=Cichorium intybus TaxID=13427 RepID=A0ACB9AKR1_CICIN|nr:hypothetical protein L2E82_40339 [Cichorium intybus]